METPLRSGSTRTFPRDPLGLLMRLLGCWCSCGWVLEILDVPNSWPCVIEHPKTSIATLQILREMWNLWICNPIWIDLRHSGRGIPSLFSSPEHCDSLESGDFGLGYVHWTQKTLFFEYLCHF